MLQIQTFLVMAALIVTGLSNFLLQVAVNNKLVNTPSRYDFTIVDDNLQSSTGSIIIGFPVDKYTVGAVSCYASNNSAITYPCSVNSNTVTLTYSSTSNLFTFSVDSITNPKTTGAATLNYEFQATNSAFNTLQTTFSTTLFTTASLTACSMALSPSTVNTEAEGIFSLTVRNEIPANGSIIIVFPSTWPSTVDSQTPIISTSTHTYRSISGTQLRATISTLVVNNALQ